MAKEVDVETFAAHVLSGAEEAGYLASFGHRGPKPDMRDYDPVPLAPTELPPLEDDLPAGGDIWE